MFAIVQSACANIPGVIDATSQASQPAFSDTEREHLFDRKADRFVQDINLDWPPFSPREKLPR